MRQQWVSRSSALLCSHLGNVSLRLTSQPSYGYSNNPKQQYGPRSPQTRLARDLVRDFFKTRSFEIPRHVRDDDGRTDGKTGDDDERWDEEDGSGWEERIGEDREDGKEC